MVSFRFQALDEKGVLVTDTIEAESPQAALVQLAAARFSPFSLDIVPGDRSSDPGLSGASGIGGLSVERIFTGISILLSAGMSIDTSVKAAAMTERSARYRAAYEGIHTDMSGGRSFSSALVRHLPVTPDVVAVIEAGERTSRMKETIANLMAFYAARRKRREELIGTLAYPSVLGVVLLAAFGLVTFVLVPAIEPVFEGQPSPPPVLLQLLSAVSRFVLDMGHWLALLVLGLVVTASFAISRRSIRLKLIDAVLRVPVWGLLAKQRSQAAFLKTMSLLLANGVRLDEALMFAAHSVPFEAHRIMLADLRASVRAGHALSHALASSGFLDPVTISLVRLGEETNRLEVALDQAASLLEEQSKRVADRITQLLPPAITIVSGVLIGILVLSVMDVLLGVNELAFR